MSSGKLNISTQLSVNGWLRFMLIMKEIILRTIPETRFLSAWKFCFPFPPLLKSLVSLYFTSFLKENLKIILGIKNHKSLLTRTLKGEIFILFKTVITSKLSSYMITNMTNCAGTIINFHLLVQGNSRIVYPFFVHIYSVSSLKMLCPMWHCYS